MRRTGAKPYRRWPLRLFPWVLTLLIAACDQPKVEKGSLPDYLKGSLRRELNHDFATVEPDHKLEFPRDHYAHPDYRMEWWYITANLDAGDGKAFALQWTLFRLAVPYRSQDNQTQVQQLYLAHVALADDQHHRVAQKMARQALKHGGVLPHPFNAYIDHWQLRSHHQQHLFPLSLTFDDGDMAAHLTLSNHGPIMLQGDQGYSRKNQGIVSQPESVIASYYYSMPWLHATGQITLDNRQWRVTGQAWLDREWSSAMLADDQQGWDWLSLHLDDGSALMIYQLRSAKHPPFRFAKRMTLSGQQTLFTPSQIHMEPTRYTDIEGKQLPTSWRVRLEEEAIDIQISPLNPRQYMRVTPPYWEGAVTASGSHSGRGFLELTGY